MTEKTFYKITNKDIFDEIQKLHGKIDEVSKKQDVTNGKVKKSTALAYVAITLVTIILGFLFQHISR